MSKSIYLRLQMWRFACTYALLQVAGALTANEESKFYNGVGLSASGGVYTFTATGIPDHATADFPTGYNPNSITAQSYSYSLAADPQWMQDGVGCLPMGIIGFATNGVAIFNPYTADGYNAVEGDNRERFDLCDGHPTNQGRYHYHKRPVSCLVPSAMTSQTGESEVLIGVALDGFPMYTTTSGEQTDLDVCNGKTVNGTYRYYTTTDFPYFMGCYRGEVVDNSVINRRSPPGGGNCYYADHSSPDGFSDLRVGTINVAIDSNLLTPDTQNVVIDNNLQNSDDSGVIRAPALGMVIIIPLISSVYSLV